MAVYGGVTFSVQFSDIFVPEWDQPKVINRTQIPYSDKEDVQFGGTQNPKLVVTAIISSRADLDTLLGLRGGTARSLSNYYGDTYADVYLVDVTNVRRMINGAAWLADLHFER